MKKIRLVLSFILLISFLVQFMPALAASDPALPAPEGFSIEIEDSHVLINIDEAEKGQYIRLERSTDSGEFRVIATISQGNTSFKDHGVSNGHVYKYRARRHNAKGYSAYTREIEVIYLRPYYLHITNVYSDQIDLEWSYPELKIPRAVPYETVVERKKDGSGWQVVCTAPFYQREFRDHGLDPDTVYYYRVRTRYSDHEYSRYIPSTHGVYRRTAIPLATPLTGFATTDSQIRLDWDREALKGQTVYLQRLDNFGEYETLFSSTTADHYFDSNLTPGEEYTYRLFLRSSKGSQSSYSETVTILTETIPAPTQMTAAPAALGRITLTWDYPYEVESGFEIWRREEGAAWERIDILPKNMTAWTDYSALTDTAYSYRVRAYRGENVFSGFTVSARVDNANPAMPSELLFVNLGSFMLIGCDEPAPPGITYSLEMRMGINEPWRDYSFGETSNPLIFYFFPAVGSEYDFRIRSENHGNIVYGPIHKLYASVPEAPVDLKVASMGSNRILLTWHDKSKIENGYRVYRIQDDKRALIGSTPANETRFTDTEITPESSVRYQVCAYNAMGESPMASVGASVPGKAVFKDIAGVPWSMDAINALAASGVISPDTNGLFHPEVNITMAEFATILLKSFDIVPEPGYLFTVKDVSPNAWYYPYLMTAIKLGMVIPDQNGYVGPLNPITKSDMAICMNRLLASRNRSLDPVSVLVLNKFTDGYQVREELKGIISSLAGDGIMPARDEQALNLGHPATRAEAAVILYRFSRKYYKPE